MTTLEVQLPPTANADENGVAALEVYSAVADELDAPSMSVFAICLAY